MTRSRIVYASLLVLAIATTALANWITEAYTPLRSEPAIYHSATSSAADSADTETPVAIQASNGDTSAVVVPWFTSSGATATILVTLHHTSTGRAHGVAMIQTATATTSEARKVTIGGTDYYPCDEVFGFGTRSSRYFDVRLLNVSAGTCALEAWTYGSQSRPAE